MLLSANISGWFIVIGTASLILLLIFFFLLFIQYGRRRMHHLQEMHRLQQAFDQALLKSQLEIQEQVFTQISQEIHDNIGQVLSLVRLNLNTLGAVPDRYKVEATDELLGRAIQDLRNLSHNLNTTFIKESGLIAAIRQLVAGLQRTGQFHTSFTTTADAFDMREDKSIILFRMVQEVINNTIKHAQATHISIEVTGVEKLDQIRINDNGKGFDTLILEKPSHGLGIANIITRAGMIGAEIQIDSHPDRGTRVRIINKS